MGRQRAGTGRRKRGREWLSCAFFACASNVRTVATAIGGDKFKRGVDGEGGSIDGGAKISAPVVGCKVRVL